jgi:mannose/fructose-specific phosphotransferase system component IIA
MDIYKNAWNTLYMIFGEQMNQEALDLMSSTLESEKIEEEERLKAREDIKQ